MNNIAEVKLSYSTKIKRDDRVKINSSKDAEKVARSSYPEGAIEHKEYAFLIVLNRASHVLGVAKLAEGGLDSCIMDVRLIFQVALLSNASAIILVHNHPSGNLAPSEADLSTTRRVKSAGKILDIKVWDHLILTAESYISLSDDGLI